MNKKVIKTLRVECHRTMWPCYVSNGLCRLSSFVIPTVAAWLVGDMTDSLLALDMIGIKSRLFPFAVAIFLEALVQPLARMLDSMLIVRRAGRYETFLMARLVRRPLSALRGETGATVAEHTMVHAPDYYYIQTCKFTLPLNCLIYGATLIAVLYIGKLHFVFGISIALLAAVPLLRTTIIGKMNAQIAADKRNYETERAREEEILFNARSFLRINNLLEVCIGNFRDRFVEWYNRTGRSKNSLDATRVVFDYLCNYGVSLGVIFVGAILVLTNKMSVGALMTGYLLLPTIMSFYRTISSQVEEIQQERDSQLRLGVFYGESEADLENMERTRPGHCPNVKCIYLNNVTFNYPGKEGPVLKNWSGSFSAVENTRIIGENGSGKTTLAKLLAGLYSPQSGTITGENGIVLSKEDLRRLVTVQDQNDFVFESTVWDNLFVDDEKKEQAQELLGVLGFNKPMDYFINAGAKNLSPGERQKIIVARALLQDTRFLILDEPFNHMDELGNKALLNEIVKRKCGVIMISHQDFPAFVFRTLKVNEHSV